MCVILFYMTGFASFKDARVELTKDNQNATKPILLQRSQSKDKVIRQVARNDRDVDGPPQFDVVKEARGRGTVGDLVRVILRNKYVTKPYSFVTENCKHFAADVFTECSDGTCSAGPNGDLPHISPRE